MADGRITFDVEVSDAKAKKALGDFSRDVKQSLGDKEVKLSADSTKAESAVKRTKSKVDDLKSDVRKEEKLDIDTKPAEDSVQSLKSVFKTIGGLIALDKVKDATLGCIEASAEWQATLSQFSQVFGDLEGQANNALGRIASQTGVSENRMKASFTKIAAFAKTTGMETSDSLNLADRAMVAVADSAAFYDRTLEDTTESLQSFLKGNYENDASLGLSCTETTRNAAANKLYGKSFNDLEESQKQLTLLQMVEDANKASGALGQAARESDTWTNKVGELQSAWSDFKSALGDQILSGATDVVGRLAGAIKKIAENVPNAVKAMKDWSPVIAGVAASIAGLALAANFSEIAGKVEAIKGSFISLFKTVSANPWVLVIGAVVGALAGLYKYNETFRNFVNSAWEGIKNTISGVVDVIKNVASAVGEFFEPIINAFRDTFGPIFEDVKNRIENILKIFDGTSDRISGWFQPLMDLVGPLGEKLSEIGGLIQQWIIDKIEKLGEIARPAIEAVSDAFLRILPVIQSLIGFFEAVGQKIAEAVQAVWPYIQPIADFLGNVLIGALQGLWAVIQSVASGAVSALSQVIQAGAGFFSFITDIFGAVINLLQGDFGSALDFLGFAFDDLFSGVSSVFNGIWDLVSGVFSGIAKAIDGFMETVFGIGGNIVEGLWNGINEKVEWVKEKIGGFCSGILNKIKGFFGIASPSKVLKEEVGKNLGEGVGEGVEESKGSVQEKVTGFCSAVGGFFSGAWGGIKKTVSGLWKGLFGGGEEEKADTTVTLDIDMTAAIQQTEKAMAQLQQAIRARFALIQADMIQANAALSERIGEAFGVMRTKAVSEVSAMVAQVQTAVQGLSKGFDGVFASITKAALVQIAMLYEGAKTQYNLLSKEAQKIILNMNAVLTALFTAMTANIIQSVTLMTQSVTIVLNAFSRSFQNVWQTLSRATVSIIQSMRSSVIAAIRMMASQILAVMNTLPAKFRDIGRKMMGELSAGINETKSTVTDTASKLVDQLVDIFIKGLGIHSPSRKMKWIGQMMIAGLLAGLDDKQIMKFTGNTVKRMQDSYGAGKLKIGTLIETLDDGGSKKLIEYLNAQSGAKGTSASIYPLEGGPYEITSWFGPRPASDTNGVGSTNHGGIDIGAPSGTPIKAMSGGVVTLAGPNGGYGNCVVIDHGNGLVSLYGHMSSIGASSGQSVSAGQTIGAVGSTGNSTGPHLHFEMRQNGAKIDPYPYLTGASVLSGDPLATSISNALTLKSQGRSTADIDSMGSNITLGINLGSLNTGAYTGVSGALKDWVTQACQITGEPLTSLDGLLYAAMCESGGNPNAVNNWDSNAAAGDPSRGLFQTIGSTFNAYKAPGMDDIWNPVHNAVAAIRYMRARYGSVAAVVNPRRNGWYGYKIGSRYIPYDMVAQLHEGEMVVPKNENPYANSGGAVLADMFEKAYWQSQNKMGAQAAPVIIVNMPEKAETNNTVNQTNYFTTSPATPSEIARQTERSARRLVKEL